MRLSFCLGFQLGDEVAQVSIFHGVVTGPLNHGWHYGTKTKQARTDRACE